MSSRAVLVFGWPTCRRTDDEVARAFGAYGRVRKLELWNTPSSMRITFDSSAAAAAAAEDLRGVVTAEGRERLDVVVESPDCDKCERMRAECERMRAECERARAPVVRFARAPSPRRGAAPAADGSFGARVRSAFGDNASTFVTSVLPPTVRRELEARCDCAIAATASRWSVPDRKAYVTSVRDRLAMRGVLSVFFEWTSFRLVLFVESGSFDTEALLKVLQDVDFKTEFGDFTTDAPSRIEI